MNTPAQCGVIKPPKTDIYSEAPHHRFPRVTSGAAQDVGTRARSSDGGILGLPPLLGTFTRGRFRVGRQRDGAPTLSRQNMSAGATQVPRR